MRYGSLPGTGALLQTLVTSTRQTPVVCGKPSGFLADLLNQKGVLNQSKTLMVGDRLNTDILFAINAKIDSCLVMSGVTSTSELKASEIQPTYVMDRLGVLYQ